MHHNSNHHVPQPAVLPRGALSSLSMHDGNDDLPLPGQALESLLASPLEGGFTIHATRSGSLREMAQRLVMQRYAQRGYLRMPWTSATEPQLLTLSASGAAGTLGTLGVRLDSEKGLKADEAFQDEMQVLRAQDRRLCEFTQLALEHGITSVAVLAGLFHAAHLYAHQVNAVELLVIEVNPRHVAYYRRMLGFKVASEQRMNPRVQAPAVLMSLDLAYAQQQIDSLGGGRCAGGMRSLYPHFFGPQEQAQLLENLFSQLEAQARQAA